MECERFETPTALQTAEISNLLIIKKYYKEALKFISEGLNLEDRDKPNEAVLCYKKGLKTLEGALKLPNGLAGLNENEASEYKKIIEKLTRAQNQVYLRLENIGSDPKPVVQATLAPLHVSEPSLSKASAVEPSAPPLRSETLPPSSFQAEQSLVDDTASRYNGTENDTWQDVKELISITEGVRLFHVDRDGDVGTWTSPCKLNVFQILKDNFEKHTPAAFMKCGEWVYPMEPGKSPVLKVHRRTYMFPDVSNEPTDNDSRIPCVGVVLSDLVPDALAKRFERILTCYCDFRNKIGTDHVVGKPKRPPPPKHSRSTENGNMDTASHAEPDHHQDVIIAEPGIAEMSLVPDRNWSDKISSGINIGSQWISWGFLKGAQYTTALVEKGAASLRDRLKPNEKETFIDPEVSNNIRQLHQATGSVVQVSVFLVAALGELTVNLGKKLAPHVIHHGNKILPDKYKTEHNEESQKKIDDVRKVAVAGIQGFGIMFLALEQAGKNLYDSIATATVQTVAHKYGSDAGEVTGNAMGAAGNTLTAYWNVQKLGPKAIAKRAAKDTGKAMVLAKEDQNIKEIGR